MTRITLEKIPETVTNDKIFEEYLQKELITWANR